MRLSRGFTLIELLVVIAIIGLLTGLGLANFMTSQKKGRDAERKGALKQIQNSLEAFVNDSTTGVYPASNASGQLLACPYTPASRTGAPCTFGVSSFTDSRTVYINPVPGDPRGARQYCYRSNGRGYQIYAQLENPNDQDRLATAVTCAGNSYNFGVSSYNTTPGGSLP